MAMLASLLRKVNKSGLITLLVSTLGLIGYFGGKAAGDVYLASGQHEKRIGILEQRSDADGEQIRAGVNKIDHISDRVDRIYELMVEQAQSHAK